VEKKAERMRMQRVKVESLGDEDSKADDERGMVSPCSK
jgi:hypothetical protein